MASIKVPSNVSSITFATSGVKTPNGSGIITGLTAAEVNAISRQGSNYQAPMLISTASNGDITFSLPTVITSITVDSVVYNVTGAVTPYGKVLSAAIPAAAGTIFKQGFILVTG